MSQQLTVTEKTINTLNKMKPNLAQVLPAHVSVDKFIRTASGAIQNNPDLVSDSVDRKTLFMACQRAAQDGLIIDNREAALVIFNSKKGNKWVGNVQYMPMTAGILKKARNSGDISTINAFCVHENDLFEYELGLEPKIKHVPNLEDPGEFRLAYAVAVLKDGSKQLEVMTKSQIEKVRKISKSGSDKDGNPKGIWLQWYEEMAKKTVLRRLCKFLPSSTDLESVIQAHDEALAMRTDDDATAEQEEQQDAPSGQTRAESAILGDEEDAVIEGEVVDDDQPDDGDPI